jgi:tRNA-binding protein
MAYGTAASVRREDPPRAGRSQGQGRTQGDAHRLDRRQGHERDGDREDDGHADDEHDIDERRSADKSPWPDADSERPDDPVAVAGDEHHCVDPAGDDHDRFPAADRAGTGHAVGPVDDAADDHDDHHHDDDHDVPERSWSGWRTARQHRHDHRAGAGLAQRAVTRRVADAAPPEIDFDHFLGVDMRVGRIVAVEDFPEARRPAWKLRIDFGPEIGIRRSSAQITNYTRERLEGTLVVGVVNFPPRQIGPVRSEVLVLGALDDDLGVVLLRPDQDAALGSRIG